MSKMSRRRFVFAAAAAIIVMVCLTSCVDIVQAYSFKDGKYTVYYKFTLSKVLLVMAEQDADEWADKLMTEDNMAGVRKVSTDLEVGGEMRLVISAATKDADERKHLPTTAGNKVYLPFLTDGLGEELNMGDSQEDQMAAAVLSSAKCRMIVGKNILPKAAKAYFAGTGGEDCQIEVYDYGECWGLEVPFIMLLDSKRCDFSRIVVITK